MWTCQLPGLLEVLGPIVVPERPAERRWFQEAFMYSFVVSYTILHLGDSGRRIRDGRTLLST